MTLFPLLAIIPRVSFLTNAQNNSGQQSNLNCATLGTKGLAATNCENRQTADLTGRAFADFWNAAPASDFATALNSKNYLAYRLGTA